MTMKTILFFLILLLLVLEFCVGVNHLYLIVAFHSFFLEGGITDSIFERQEKEIIMTMVPENIRIILAYTLLHTLDTMMWSRFFSTVVLMSTSKGTE